MEIFYAIICFLSAEDECLLCVISARITVNNIITCEVVVFSCYFYTVLNLFNLFIFFRVILFCVEVHLFAVVNKTYVTIAVVLNGIRVFCV